MMSLDVAFPRNEKEWFDQLPVEFDKQIENNSLTNQQTNNQATSQNNKATSQNNKATNQNNQATSQNNKATSQNNPQQVENELLNYQKNIPAKLKLNVKPELTVTIKTNKINEQLENNSLNNQVFFNQSYNKTNAKISKVQENSQPSNKQLVNEINNQPSNVQSSKNSYSRPLSELKSDILNGLNFFLYYNDELDLKSLINRQILNTSDPFK